MFFADHARNFDAIKTRLEGWVGDTAGRGVCSGIAWYQIVGRFFFSKRYKVAHFPILSPWWGARTSNFVRGFDGGGN